MEHDQLRELKMCQNGSIGNRRKRIQREGSWARGEGPWLWKAPSTLWLFRTEESFRLTPRLETQFLAMPLRVLQGVGVVPLPGAGDKGSKKIGPSKSSQK